MTSRRHTPAVDRFPFFVTITETDDCINWPGAKMKTGYGFMNEGGRPIVATHVALQYVGKPRPSPEMFALHSCDNPSCVNPRHLRWGTHNENMADVVARGRHWATVRNHCKHGHDWTPENTSFQRGKRVCRSCQRVRSQLKRVNERAARNQTAY